MYAKMCLTAKVDIGRLLNLANEIMNFISFTSNKDQKLRGNFFDNYVGALEHDEEN